MYRVRQSSEPEYLADQLNFDNRNGRVIVPNIKLGLAQDSFCLRGAASWNSLPLHVRKTRKIGEFKSQLRKWIKVSILRFLE